MCMIQIFENGLIFPNVGELTFWEYVDFLVRCFLSYRDTGMNGMEEYCICRYLTVFSDCFINLTLIAM